MFLRPRLAAFAFVLVGAGHAQQNLPFPVESDQGPAASSVKTVSTDWKRLAHFHAVGDTDAVYRLPYPDGLAFPMGQAPGGFISTHTSPESHHAVDVQMPAGTPVIAARNGLVIHTEGSQVEGGLRLDLLTKANEVWVQHVDGTIAIYAHLAHNGVFVRPGQRVVAGNPIGLSGATGYAGGAHLHFAVVTLAVSGDRLSMTSLPFRFYIGSPPIAFKPQYGLLVRADYRMEATLKGALESPQVPANAAASPAAGP